MWSSPKTDWDPTDGVADSDFNRMEENTRILGQGNGRASITEIASANNLDINDTDESFIISGTAEIKYIKVGTRQPGNRIQLRFTGATTSLHHDEGTLSGYAPMWLTKIDYSTGDYLGGTTAMGKFIEFIFDGTYWRSGFLPTA